MYPIYYSNDISSTPRGAKLASFYPKYPVYYVPYQMMVPPNIHHHQRHTSTGTIDESTMKAINHPIERNPNIEYEKMANFKLDTANLPCAVYSGHPPKLGEYNHQNMDQNYSTTIQSQRTNHNKVSESPKRSNSSPKRRRSVKSQNRPNRKSHIAEVIQENVKFPVKLRPTNCSQETAEVFLNLTVKKYSTSAIDPKRNYLTVFEYPVNKHWVIWDYETGFVHLTGIWKASLYAEQEGVPKCNTKADIVKLLETTPKQYQQHIKRIRGGFLKIQGTWLPYDMCKLVAKKFCYYIRYSLVPLFGQEFPDQCLKPEDPAFGKLRLDELNDVDTEEEEPINISPKIEAFQNTSSKLDSETASKTKSVQSNQAEEEQVSPLAAIPILQQQQQQQQQQQELYVPPQQETNLSYNEMYDLVSASRCLQSIRAGRSDHSCNGISSILEAAGISKQPPPRRRSLKIHDLIS